MRDIGKLVDDRDTLPATQSDQTAWLIEETWSGYVHYVHKDFNALTWLQTNREHDRRRRKGLPVNYDEAILITKDVNLAMRFYTEASAKAWLTKQPKFMSHGDQFQAREHLWCAPPATQSGMTETDPPTQEHILHVVGRLREIVTACDDFVASGARLTMPAHVLELWQKQALQLTDAADLICRLSSGWSAEGDMVAILTEQCATLQARISEVEKERDLWKLTAGGEAELGQNAVARLEEIAAALTARAEAAEARRNDRQAKVFDWGCRAFGNDHMRSPQQRALRLMEEAIELAQSVFCDPAQLHKLVDYVYSRPVGQVEAELGGVSVCLLAMSECVRANADELEQREVDRILAKPIEHFAARNRQKNDAGFLAKEQS